MQEINIQAFTDIIKFDLENGEYSPIVGIGLSGIGKTESIFDITQELGIGFKELRLVAMNELDILGMPEAVDINGVKSTTYAANENLPREGRDPEVGLLVLDEFTSGSEALRTACYQLMDSKRALGSYKLPPKWKIIVLGNGPDDGGNFQGATAAELSRCLCFRVVAKLEDWKAWAYKHGINSTVIAYLTQNPDSLHKMDTESEYASVFPCPRSWAALSKRLNMLEEKKGTLDDMTVMVYAAGAVGAKEAAEFQVFYRYNNQMFDIDALVKKGVMPSNIDSISEEALLISSLKVGRMLQGIIDEEPDIMNISDECISSAASVCNFILAVWKSPAKGIDTATTVFSEISNACPDLYGITIDDSDTRFSEQCPEYASFRRKLLDLLKTR